VVVESEVQNMMHCVINPSGKMGGFGNTPNLYRLFATPGGQFDKRSGETAFIGDKSYQNSSLTKE
jgi:hypothetical protein